MQTHEPSRKSASSQTPVSAYAFLAPRPFAEPPKPEALPPLTASGGLGISLARLNCSPLEPRPVLQPKLTIGKPGDQYEQKDCVPPVLQPKLTIGEPGDPYEQEADRVAADVVQRLHSPEALPIAPLSSGKGDEKPIQRSSAMTATVPTLQADFETQLNQARSGGAPLDNAFRAKIEPIMGADFSGVRVHTDAQADQLSRSIQAKAFTTKQDVFFRQGAYEPGSREGKKLIAHELTHVVQQNGSAVQQSPMLIEKEEPYQAASASFKNKAIRDMSFGERQSNQSSETIQCSKDIEKDDSILTINDDSFEVEALQIWNYIKSKNLINKFENKKIHIIKTPGKAEKVCHHWAFGGLADSFSSPIDEIYKSLQAIDKGESVSVYNWSELKDRDGLKAHGETVETSIRVFEEMVHSARLKNGMYYHKFINFEFLFAVEGGDSDLIYSSHEDINIPVLTEAELGETSWFQYKSSKHDA